MSTTISFPISLPFPSLFPLLGCLVSGSSKGSLELIRLATEFAPLRAVSSWVPWRGMMLCVEGDGEFVGKIWKPIQQKRKRGVYCYTLERDWVVGDGGDDPSRFRVR